MVKKRTWIACLMLAFLVLALTPAGPVLAGDTRDQAQVAEVARILPPLVLAPALVDACSKREPARHDFYAGMLTAWRGHNHADNYEQSLARLAARSPSATALMAALKGKARDAANNMVTQKPTTCAQLAQLLASPSLTLGDNATAKAAIDAQPSGASTLYSVGQMSALAQTAITGAASPSEGLKAATRRLGGLGPVAVWGHVVQGSHALQELDAERQSIMNVVCFSYDQPHGEESLTALGGQAATVSGVITEVWSTSAMRMDKCRILGGSAGLVKAGVSDDAGLEMRPPSVAEAQAGPNLGIATSDVADVLYQFTSSFRMDGFGNGFMDRQEHTFVLLKNGTAYRHDWPFPFQDLNLALVKRRQPDNWFLWTRRNGDFVLSPDDGRSRGQDITLKADTELRPMPPGATFSHNYFFLDVGKAGLTRNRDYRFRADGSLDLDHSSLVAAKTAPGAAGVSASTPGTSFTGGGLQNGFVASAGANGGETVRYRIAGYVIELTHADGSVERRSIGLMSGEPMPPKNLYLGGQTLWSKQD